MDEAGPFLLDHHRDECLRPRTVVTLDGHGSDSVEPRGGLVECGRGGEWVVISRSPACQVHLEGEFQSSSNAYQMATRVGFSETLGVGACVSVIISPNRVDMVEK